MSLPQYLHSKIKIIFLTFATLVAISGLSLLTSQSVSAAQDTCTWTGAGSDAFISNSANWSGCDNANVPEADDNLIFPAGASSYSVNVDLAATYNQVEVNSGTYSFIGSNPLSVDNTLSVADGVSPVFDTPARFTYPAGGSAAIVRLQIGDGATPQFNDGIKLDIGSPAQLQIFLEGGDTFHVPIISGSTSSLSVSNDSSDPVKSTAIFDKNSTFTADLVYSYSSNIECQAANCFGAIANDIDVRANSASSYGTAVVNTPVFDYKVRLDAESTATSNPTMLRYAQSTTRSERTVFASTSPVQIELDAGAVVTDSADWQGTSPGPVSILGGSSSSKLNINGDIDFGAPTDVKLSKVAVYVNGTMATTKANFLVGADARLGGSAYAADVELQGGVLAPGNSPGCLTVTNISSTSASTFQAELDGTTICTEYDNLTVTNAADLNNVSLDVAAGFTPTAGDSFTILTVEAGGTLTGEFTGLADDSEFTQDGNTWRIDYNRTGSGEKTVVLTYVTSDVSVGGSSTPAASVDPSNPAAPETGLAPQSQLLLVAAALLGITFLAVAGAALYKMKS